MAYWGARISYAVNLIMAEEAACAPLFPLRCLNIFMMPRRRPCDGADKWADRKTHHSLILHIIFFLLVYFFQLLRKTNKSSQDDPLLPIYSFSIFMRICKWRGVSFNRRVSHVTRAEGSKGTRGGGGSRATDEGGDPHLPPSAVRASRSLHNENTPWVFFSFAKTR